MAASLASTAFFLAITAGSLSSAEETVVKKSVPTFRAARAPFRISFNDFFCTVSALAPLFSDRLLTFSTLIIEERYCEPEQGLSFDSLSSKQKPR